MIETAITLARFAHAGQFRRDGKTPYITHPEAVAGRLAGESSEVICAAWLHDVLEDTAMTAETMRVAGISEAVIEAVHLLTKNGENYIAYLHRIRDNEIARKVKIADMLHNLSDHPTPRQIRKYAQGLLELVPFQ